MTENTQNPGSTPEEPDASDASTGEASAATVAHTEEAFSATDAFGQPLPFTDDSFSAAPSSAAQPAAEDAPAGVPSVQAGLAPAKEWSRRRPRAAFVAALAVAALIGGASGAGVTALLNDGQDNSIPTTQAQGPASITVNNTDSVNAVTMVAAKASPSVVTISVSSGNAGGTGSGVILSEDGYVLTNTHVVTLDGAIAEPAIQVKSNDGKLYAATIVGTDPLSDLAVIKITDASGLTPVEWADSSKLNVGDTVVAIGAPLGLAGTVTNGIVSALNRSIQVASSAAPSSPDETDPDATAPGDEEPQSPFDFYFNLPDQNGSEDQQAPSAASSISLSVIQTDAAINPGNSGGPLLNAKGELIGINVAIAGTGTAATSGNIGVGFSIPSNLAKRISEELIANGTATHGLLGASVGNAADVESSTTVGAVVRELTPNGAAAEAGLAAGDVITNFNGFPITDAQDLTAQVRVLPAGGTADLTYVRDGRSVTVSVTVGAL